MAPPLLLLEDDPLSARLITDILGVEGYSVEIAPTLAAFRAAFSPATHGALLLDLRLPDGDGLSLLRALRDQGVATPVIILTANDSVAQAVEAMKLGAFDFFTKPADREKLRISIRNALQLASRDSEIRRLRQQLTGGFSIESIVAVSEPMKRAMELARKCAATAQTVLIQGQSGTGKAVIARAIHGLGPRAAGPFVEVNCAAVPEALLESELFGHERGSFTGATATRRGKFELAGGGTIFLDEIGDMLPAMQAKLLHVAEERHYFRVGSDERREADARILCATNHDLALDVEEGRFRKDLFYRINRITIDLAPLRERPEDVVPMAEAFLRAHAEREGRTVRQIDPAALEVIRKHAWPGNVRELENVIGRAVVVAEGDRLTTADLPAHLRLADTPPPRRAGEPPRLLDAVEDLEHRMILEALERNEWVKARAARDLGITDRILSYKMNLMGVSRPAQRR